MESIATDKIQTNIHRAKKLPDKNKELYKHTIYNFFPQPISITASYPYGQSCNNVWSNFLTRVFQWKPLRMC